MITPNFLNEEFVDQDIFNAAMQQLVSSIRETGANDTFLLPGVINPASLIFTTNATLQVVVTTPNTGVTAFKCLFQTGAITAGFGTTNGAISSSYTVDFTALVPVAGSVTAYIVAQYAQVSESSSTIIGSPPGHPDYSATFIPYIGYTQLQDTLNIFTTTTAPDNQTTIELARTTLTAGQTQVNSVSTANQVLAKVNVASTLAGDVTGNINSNIISNLQGKPVAASTPAPNQVLQWNGTNWVPGSLPTTLPPSGPAGGDLTGSYPNPQVFRSSVATFVTNAIAAAGAIGATGNISAGGNVSATGNLIGAPASASNQAIVLGQMGNIGALAPVNPTSAGDIYHQSFTLPVLQGGVLVSILVNFGFYSFYGLNQSAVINKDITISYHTPFTQGILTATFSFATNDFSGSGLGAFVGESLTVETPQLNAPGASHTGTQLFLDASGAGGSVHIAGPSTVGLLGVWWLILGI